MKSISTLGRRAAFALAVAGSLGFGGKQALAAPAPAAAPYCGDSICVFQCGAPAGREVYRGICVCCLGGT